jgi:hypothetical protein
MSADGAKYVGEWKDGNFNGKGTFTFNNNPIYQGEWKDGKYNGYGILWENGVTKAGIWLNDERVQKLRVTDIPIF